MANTTDLYIIHCLTNLHAGSGDSTYGIVDKEVQKDPIEGMPVIHASGLKGAFRELFEYHNNSSVEGIFGADTDPSKRSNPDRLKAGKYYFMEARMLFLPVRSSRKPYFMATSQEIIRRFIQEQEDLGTGKGEILEGAFAELLKDEYKPEKGRPVIFSADAGTVYIDEFDAVTQPQISASFGDWPVDGGNIALFHHDDLKEVCKRLPVIARNYLENGISGNLWYEEIVPRGTLFYFYISRPSDEDHFDTQMKKLGDRVQIGGNASVGYGLCKLLKF
ncbi:MAG: type III-B CRISPR module RAMP protein Cmr4 [Saprospiraceae bacterium]|nr:type III-B CRISPR module RAMP protein Cmr4 [Saprospiraceae bacterium]